MNYPILTGAVIVYFLGIETIICIARKESVHSSFPVKEFLSVSAAVLIAVTINYFARKSYRGELIFAAIPLISVASLVISVKVIGKTNINRLVLYLCLLPAGVAVLSAEYAANYPEVLLYSFKSIVELFVVSFLTLKIYSRVKNGIPDIFKGLPAILILIALITMILTPLLQ